MPSGVHYIPSSYCLERGNLCYGISQLMPLSSDQAKRTRTRMVVLQLPEVAVAGSRLGAVLAPIR